MHSAGQDPARIIQCRVTNVNLVNWTVDVISQFDRHYYRDIQLSASYLHYNRGEGVYVVPDVGAVCLVTLPSDSSPPFVSGFLAPMESVGDTGKPDSAASFDTIATTLFGDQEVIESNVTTSDAPAGTRSRGGDVPFKEVDARFDAGRAPAKTGDIYMRGRDGNFVTLHRGGVLQIGATELSQRIFLPLANKVLDISGNYEHMNTGGGVQWGLQEGPSVANPATQRMDTYRVYANDQYCDIRVARGKVLHPVGEPDHADSTQDQAIDKSNPIVYEVVLAQNGFKAGSGDPANDAVRNQTKLRFFFDRSGSVFLRAEGTAFFAFKKSVKVKAQKIDVEIDTTLNVSAPSGVVVTGGPSVDIKADVVRLQQGQLPIARIGDQVILPLGTTFSFTGTVSGAPATGVLTTTTPIIGSIISGNNNLLG